jgi:hypothetical protein
MCAQVQSEVHASCFVLATHSYAGVVAVAVMGLYGASTNCWDMSTAAHHTFDGFWETLAFAVNALVFMWSGAHVVNFFIRSVCRQPALGLAQGVFGAGQPDRAWMTSFAQEADSCS